MKKHVVAFYSFRNMKDRALDRLPGEIGGQEFQMSDLEGCTVRLLDVTDRVICELLSGCNVFIAACMESVVLRNCTNCTFTIACKDLRLSDCDGCTLSVHTKISPTIEDSARIVLCPYRFCECEASKTHLRVPNWM